MKKFIIEREIPGLGDLTFEELQNISGESCKVIENMGKPYHWITSFVAKNKMYCIHIARDIEDVREHSRKSGFPADKIVEVLEVIDLAS